MGTAIAWALFNLYRKKYIESPLFGENVPFEPNTKFFIGLVLFCLFWVSLFGLAGFYHDVYRRSRLTELSRSIGITILGCITIFFALLLDDYIVSYKSYYKMLFSLFGCVFVLTYAPRLIITSRTIHRIHTRKIGYPTIIVGDGERAVELYRELEAEVKSQGYKILGYVHVSSRTSHSLKGIVPHLGSVKEVNQVIHNYGIEEVILALDHADSHNIVKIINELLCLNVNIKAIPSLYDYLSGRVKMSGILNAPLLQISFELMPPWQVKLKQFIDYSFGTLALLVSLPLAVSLAILIKLSSKGPILHRQERVGQYGKPFTLYKFRSMGVDAELHGPALSSKTDSRVTPIGRFMRKTRLDEIPNFINVIKGEMSLVGPRPERQYYIDQIMQKAPHYIHLQKVKPGITSWGQVKFGYAENVDQMVERLKYDLLYLENMSIYVDLKIIIYTLITVSRGRGV
jgi:exopolysaccharide biosynthesis polyprenyl glycosylphosphotransferase